MPVIGTNLDDYARSFVLAAERDNLHGVGGFTCLAIIWPIELFGELKCRLSLAADKLELAGGVITIPKRRGVDDDGRVGQFLLSRVESDAKSLRNFLSLALAFSTGLRSTFSN